MIEIVFNYHGIGRLLWDAVGHRDYPLLQSSFLMFTFVLIFTNVVADFVYFYLDPRIRTGTSEIKQAKGWSNTNVRVFGISLSNSIISFLYVFSYLC